MLTTNVDDKRLMIGTIGTIGTIVDDGNERGGVCNDNELVLARFDGRQTSEKGG